MRKPVSLTFTVMTVLFCVCLIVANLMEIKVVPLGGVTLTAGMIVFPISYIINDLSLIHISEHTRQAGIK